MMKIENSIAKTLTQAATDSNADLEQKADSIQSNNEKRETLRDVMTAASGKTSDTAKLGTLLQSNSELSSQQTSQPTTKKQAKASHDLATSKKMDLQLQNLSQRFNIEKLVTFMDKVVLLENPVTTNDTKGTSTSEQFGTEQASQDLASESEATKTDEDDRRKRVKNSSEGLK